MIVLNYRFEMPSWLKRSAVNQLLKLGMYHVAKYWHSHILPKHFTASGAAEYRYRKRKAKYQQRKKRQVGHNKPLTYKGTLERRLRASSGVRISATSRKATLTLGAGRATYRQRDKELTAVSSRDVAAMSHHLVEFLHDRINKWTRTVRVRIR